ncbi:MAG: alpha/beta hydrolase [Clostridia bacterium]|nr:alpha/beta hydrolase [Clostridia bacterium]
MAIKGLKNPEWMEQPKAGNPVTKTDHLTRKFEDLAYGPEDLQKLDIYLPEEGEGPFPTILMFHGGGLMYCDKHDFHLYPLLYALKEGFAVAAVNYRLLPKVDYPTPVYDAYKSLLYLYENGAEYGLDVENFFLWGTSGGGNLSLMCAMKEGMVLPPELADAKKVPVRGTAALCAEATVTEFGAKIGSVSDQAQTWVLKATLYLSCFKTLRPKEKQTKPYDIFQYLPAGIAPLYIQHGDLDPAVPYTQSVRLFEEAGKVLAPEDLVLDTLVGASHAGNGVDYFLPENVLPIVEFFRAHMV